MSNLILRLNKAGLPMSWVDYEAAATLYAKEMVVWTLGEEFITLHGGLCRITGEQSLLRLHPIIATEGVIHKKAKFSATLCNTLLFKRDQNICMYCGDTFHAKDLTCDHIIPKGMGGKDTWQNCVTACRPCNHRKGCRTPEQSGMPLLAVPFRPNRHEYLVLQNRRIVADQMEYLRSSSSQFRVQ